MAIVAYKIYMWALDEKEDEQEIEAYYREFIAR